MQKRSTNSIHIQRTVPGVVLHLKQLSFNLYQCIDMQFLMKKVPPAPSQLDLQFLQQG